MKTLRWGPLLLRYARDRLAHIVLAVACPAVYALVCALAGAPLAGVVYAGALVLAGGLIALCVDLPRVFDHGYTGLNGRKDKRATGLGLYLSRRILDQLGHTISIASEPGRGTRVTIGLDSLRMRVE